MEAKLLQDSLRLKMEAKLPHSLRLKMEAKLLQDSLRLKMEAKLLQD